MNTEREMGTTDGLGAERGGAALPVSAVEEIAAMLPTEDEWRSAASFMEAVAGVLDRHNVERPDHYEDVI